MILYPALTGQEKEIGNAARPFALHREKKRHSIHEARGNDFQKPQKPVRFPLNKQRDVPIPQSCFEFPICTGSYIASFAFSYRVAWRRKGQEAEQ